MSLKEDNGKTEIVIDREYAIKHWFRNKYPVPIVKNAESLKRLIDFSYECLSANAPLTQGYYFNSRENYMQFYTEVLLAYYVNNHEESYIKWETINTIKIVDQVMDDIIFTSSFDNYDLLFIINYYHHGYTDKRHKVLYHLVSEITESREKEQKRTFVLSLTKDVGINNFPYSGFSLPMFPIKEKIREVLEAIKTGKNPWE